MLKEHGVTVLLNKPDEGAFVQPRLVKELLVDYYILYKGFTELLSGIFLCIILPKKVFSQQGAQQMHWAAIFIIPSQHD